MQKYNSREEVPEKYKWDLTPFFKDEEEFLKSYDKTSKLVDRLKEYVGCTKDANRLYEYLTKFYQALADYEDINVYAFLINDENLGKESSLLRLNKAETLGTNLANNTSFFEPELLKLSSKEYQELFKKNPKLAEYKEDLDQVYRKKKHILSEKEEIIINELVSAMNHFDEMSSKLLNQEHDYGRVKVDGEDVVIATTNYRYLMRNKDVKLRRKVYSMFNKKLEQYSGTNASYLHSYVAMNEKIAKLRNFDSSWEQKLFGLNISDKVYQTLIKTTEDNLKSLHRFYELRRDVLGLKKLNGYDLNLEIVDDQREYTIEEAQELVREALKPLGSEYLKKYAKIIDNHYIDYCQYKGKCSGGYSASSLKQDSRILMSFNGNLEAVSTIAHECGHNINHQYVSENNPYQYRFTPNIMAEVTSLTNECLLSSYLMKHGKTKNERLAGIINILDVIASNLFGSVREGKMELMMYDKVRNGSYITKEFMDKLTYDSVKKYYGNAVKMDKYAKNKWITRSHYYMHFYLFSYAICISVASSVAAQILEGNQETLDRYMDFLKCGSDKYPMEAFKILGVDLEESKVYEEAIKYFDSLIDEFYKIYNEVK